MKSPSVLHLLALLIALAPAGCERAPDTADSGGGSVDPTPHAPLSSEGSDIKLSQTRGTLGPWWEDRFITFPTDMVDPAMVGSDDRWDEEAAAAVPPVVLEPDPGFKFRWISPRRGMIYFEHAFPEIAYRLTLRDGLVDRAGDLVNPDGWGAEFASEDFGIVGVKLFNADRRDTQVLTIDQHLPVQPRARLQFSRDVFPSEIAGRVAFVDTESRERHPVVACLDEWQTGKPQGLVFVQPVAPLPTGRHYWLVVERLGAATGDYDTDFLRVYPAGYCAPFENVFARAYNQPRTGIFARAFFNARLDPRALDAASFTITPPVGGLTVRADHSIAVLEGEFEEGTEYILNVDDGIRSLGGIATTGPQSWPLSIPERRASVIMPADFIAQPFASGVDVAVSHSRTGALTWTLAEVPAGSVSEVKVRLREFAEPALSDAGGHLLDPRDGTLQFAATDELIPALGLRAVASDSFPAAPGNDESTRRVRWKPDAGGQVAGLYLLEVVGRGVDGRPCGNRSLISLSDWFMNFIATGEESGAGVRLSQLADGTAAADVSVQAYAEDGRLLDEATTDNEGLARFGVLRREGEEPAFLLAGNALGRCLQEGDYPASSIRWGGIGERDGYDALLMTNGDLYEPGEDVHIYAVVRRRIGDQLTIPAEGTEFGISIEVGEEYAEEQPIGIDASGSGSLVWPIPANLVPSRISFALTDGEGGWLHTLTVDVAEFRPPTFSMDLAAATTTGTVAEATVTSFFFHGSANRDATLKYTAEWVMQDWLPAFVPDYSLGGGDGYHSEESGFRHHTPADDPFEIGDFGGSWIDWGKFAFDDRYSEPASKQGMEGVLASMKILSGGRLAQNLAQGLAIPSSHPDRGEAVVGEDGTVTLRSECPFPNLGRSHRAQVFWTVDLTTVAGQTRRAAAQQRVQFPERALALEAKTRAVGETGLPVRLTTITAEDKVGAPGAEADVEVVRRTINTVQERLSENVVRYRNAPEFESVWKERLELPFEGVLPSGAPGDYVVVAVPVESPHAQPVSAAFPGVLQRSDMVVLNDFSFEAELVDDRVAVGDTAVIAVGTPFAGAIRVTVETDDLLETLPLVQLPGTSGRIEVPVRKDYFPNAFLRLHLMGAPGAGGAPAERFAVVPLAVRDPAIELAVTPVLDSPQSRVREPVTGHVLVEAEGQPVAGAEVVVFAIDDAVLSLGNWELPDTTKPFYPERYHRVITNAALGKQWTAAEADVLSQFEKGYILGSGREKTLIPTVIIRENENPRPLWLTSVQTDAQGRAPFSFEAPDSLTSYRVAALAHTTSTQIGAGETSVPVSNPLRVEPFLPQFVREGDDLILRCQITQEAAPNLPVRFSVEVEGAATLVDGGSQALALAQGESEVATARIKVGKAGVGTTLRLVFQAIASDGAALSDGAAVTLDVLPRFTERTEIATGELAPPATWDDVSSAPARWSAQPDGSVDIMVSGTRWLAQIATFSPGSGEGIAMADLASSALAPYLVPHLAAYLPWASTGDSSPDGLPSWVLAQATRDAAVAADLVEESIIPAGAAGWLPQFPGGDEPDDPATALVSWAISLAKSGEPLDDDMGYDEDGNTGPPVRTSVWSERLLTKLAYWRDDPVSIGARSGDLPQAIPFVRAAALLATATGRRPGRYYYSPSNGDLHVAARALFARRDESLGLEGRCFLALAIPQVDALDAGEELPRGPVLADAEWATLTQEIEGAPLPDGLDPVTLGTPQRAAAIRLLTLGALYAQEVGASESLRSDRLAEALLIDDRPLTAQENIWRLLAADTYLQLEDPARLADAGVGRDDYVASPNGVTRGWLRHPAANLNADFSSGLRTNVPAYWLLRATYRAAIAEPVGSADLAMTREVYSHNEPGRDGSAGTPFKVGDYVMLNYRITSDRPRDFVVLEEQLPAALETLNPDLPAVQKAFAIPAKPTDAKLGHADYGAQRIRLTFASLPAGESTYSVLTQVVAGGTFSWPAARASLLYDQRLAATTADVQILAVP